MLNLAVQQKQLAEVDALMLLLQSHMSAWRGATTAEQRARIESEGLALLETMKALDLDITKAEVGSIPTIEEFRAAYNEIRYSLTLASTKLRKLIELFVEYLNSQRLANAQIVNKKLQINQRLSYLDLWSEVESKWMLVEKFLTREAAGSSSTTAIWLNQGICTLPIIDTVTLQVDKSVLGARSNGAPGNSDIEILDVNNLSYMLDSSARTSFFYEKLDTGPCLLELHLYLAKTEIINSIMIEPIIGTDGFTVEEILIDGKSVLNITADDKREVNSNGFSWLFEPTEGMRITLLLKQERDFPLMLRGVSRKQYAIGLRNVFVRRYVFSNTGMFESLDKQIPEGLYAGVPFVDGAVYKVDSQVSFDGGATWQQSEIQNGIGTAVTHNGTATTLKYRFNLNVESSYMEKQDLILDFGTLTVQKRRANSQFQLSKDLNSYWFYEPKVMRRGSNQRLLLAKGSQIKKSIQLPINLLQAGVAQSDVALYVNRIPYEYVEDNSSIGTEEWSFTDDYSEVLIPDTASDAEVYISITPEECSWYRVGNTVRHKMTLPFDPDTNTFLLKSLPEEAQYHSMVLPRDKKIFMLVHTNVEPDSVIINYSNGTTLERVDTRSELGANKFFLNTQTGLIELNDIAGTDVGRISYKHWQPTAVDGARVYFNGIVPEGIEIDISSLKGRTITQTLGSPLDLNPVWTPLVVARRSQAFDMFERAWTLSSNNIIPGSVKVQSDLFVSNNTPMEVSFIDGRSEFLGLINVENERTVEAIASGTGKLTFNLVAGVSWWSEGRAVFEDTDIFATWVSSALAVNAIGKYHVDANGLVTVHVGSGGTLPGDIRIRYSYVDPTFNSYGKYSIDYQNGVFYASETLNASTITYKTASYAIEYDVVAPVRAYGNARTAVFEGSSLHGDGVVKHVSSIPRTVRTNNNFSTPVLESFGIRFQ